MATLIQLALLFAGPYYKAYNAHAHGPPMCLGPGREMFDAHFITVRFYPVHALSYIGLATRLIPLPSTIRAGNVRQPISSVSNHVDTE